MLKSISIIKLQRLEKNKENGLISIDIYEKRKKEIQLKIDSLGLSDTSRPARRKAKRVAAYQDEYEAM